ncbi:MAG TPA: ATP synthase F0 subunit B [Candidatus Binatia bacterium]|nr:ATP synthase F0 subunit B [Candidatus Binatia bacterium]
MLSFPPDWTFIFQILLFLVLWTFLRRFLFEPNLAVLTNREERSAGALKEASRVKAEAEEMGEQYRTHLAGIRAGAMQQVDTVYREAEEQARVLIESARADAARTMAAMRETLAQELAQARQSLTANIPTFSREIAAKLLGRPLT